MPVMHSEPLDDVWKSRLGLASRHSPELFESADHVVDEPHALAIRTALDELGLSAVFCVQGVPTVAILVTKHYNRAQIVDLHGALWNQGLVSLLLVIAGDTLRAFSLVKQPYKDADESFDQRCLIDTLHQTADVLRFRNLIYGAESGRLWKEYANYFDPNERIDQVLLDNLKQSHSLLCDEDQEYFSYGRSNVCVSTGGQHIARKSSDGTVYLRYSIEFAAGISMAVLSASRSSLCTLLCLKKFRHRIFVALSVAGKSCLNFGIRIWSARISSMLMRKGLM